MYEGVDDISADGPSVYLQDPSVTSSDPASKNKKEEETIIK